MIGNSFINNQKSHTNKRTSMEKRNIRRIYMGAIVGVALGLSVGSIILLLYIFLVA